MWGEEEAREKTCVNEEAGEACLRTKPKAVWLCTPIT